MKIQNIQVPNISQWFLSSFVPPQAGLRRTSKQQIIFTIPF